MHILKIIDPDLANLLDLENQRQSKTINLIASENYTHDAIMEVTGSILTNKYAEGLPGKRYYGGCEIIDQIENLAIERCKELFKSEYANVQPHSGSQANMAVYTSILKPGDTIMGMSLSAGGHLTHGHSVNFSGSLYNVIQYNVNRETEYLDYNQIEKLAYLHKPKLIIAGASAYSRIIDFEKFSQIAKSVNAYLLADMAHISGLVAAKLHPNPVEHADFITSTTHKTLRGPRGGFIMAKKEFESVLDKAIMPGIQGGPLMHIIAAKAVAFKLAASEEFKKYQSQVIKNAKVMAETFKSLGYRIVSDGTDNHLFVIDLENKNISGKDAENILEKVGITVSRSLIPFDKQKPWLTSGIRIGTAAITSRGFKEEECKKIVYWIDEIIKNYKHIKQFQTYAEKFINGINEFLGNL